MANDADLFMADDKPKRKMKQDEENERLCQAIEAEVGEAYTYSSAELYEQLGTAWRHYYRMPMSDEIGEAGEDPDGLSEWVSPMVMNSVNQIRSFITSQYHRNSAPIVKFEPKSSDDVASAQLANEYVNYMFRQKLDGSAIIDKTIFNAALLKMCPVRVFMNCKKEAEEYEFKYYGDSLEELVDNLAYFYVANPDLKDEKPYKKVEKKKKDGSIFYHYRWKMDKVVDRYPDIKVINPGNFFVSRQAESLDEARMVCEMDLISISELKALYPDAPKLNGVKKSEEADFWAELVSDYYEWYQQTEWLARWSYDSLGYTQQYDIVGDESAGLGSKRIFVIDAEIMADVDDTGVSYMYRVVKTGSTVLYKECISERSFLCGTLVPTGNKWVGLSIPDLIQLDKQEETINIRAFTDAAVDAAHSVAIVDQTQVDVNNGLDLGPGGTIFLKDTPIQTGKEAISWKKAPGADPSTLQAADKFSQFASSLTGAGANFQGATQDSISDMRISTETAKVIDNNSSLMLNYFARNYGNFLCELLVKLLNTAVKGQATNQLLQIKHDWMEVAPEQMQVRSDWILNADFGVNDEQEKQIRAQAVLGLIQSATGGGGQTPDGMPIPQLPIQLTPQAGYQAGKLMLEASGITDVDTYLADPEDVGKEMLQQVAQAQIQEQVQQGIQAGVQQAVQQAMQMPEAQKMQAETQEIAARIGKIMAETGNLEMQFEEKAYEAANKDFAEERREDESAWKEAKAMEELEIKRMEAERNAAREDRRLELEEKLADKAENTGATAII